MLTIILPTLNEERVLRTTLERLRALTTIPFEVVVSDGNSCDATREIAQEFADHVIVYQGEARQTIANARNLGARVAKGDFLLFIDADIELPNIDRFLNEALAAFAADPELVAATVPVSVLKEQETIRDQLLFGVVNLVHQLNNNLLGTGSASGEFQLIRRTAFEQVGGFNDDLVAYEDWDLFDRLGRIGKTRFLTKRRAFHTGRRAHKVGHARLLLTWIGNALWFKLFRRAFSKEWSPVR